jgi:predicted kinase
MNQWQYLYNSKAWKHARERHLFKNPRCVMCLASNRQTVANEVDHIIPHRGDELLFWDRENYQSLCKSCHSEKTYYETIKSNLLPKSMRIKSNDITFLIGAPCSGRRAWAKKQNKKIIDFDNIKREVSGSEPYEMDSRYMSTCLAVRNQIISKTEEPFIIISDLYNLKHIRDWIKKLKTKASLMITTQRQCFANLKKSQIADKHLIELMIKRWYTEYTPSGYEVLIKNG